LNIEILAAAESEIDEIYDYFERETKGLGPQFLDELLHVFKNIKRYPEAWPNFSGRTKRCLFSKSPYGVIYQLRKEKILVVAVAHLHRKPQYWKDRL
jgi:plasmid stabilization system protein ParE